MRTAFLVAVCLAASGTFGGSRVMADVRAGDAYARTSKDPQRWTIGTAAIDMSLECKSGKLRLVSCRNKLTKPATEYVAAGEASDVLSWGVSNWRVENSETRKIVYGGRPAVQLDITLSQPSVKVAYHVVAFPGTSIIRQWAEIENTGQSEISLEDRDGSFSINIRSADKGPFAAYWMTGANNTRPDAGLLHREEVGPSYSKELTALGTFQLTPWIGVQRDAGAKDGVFVALDSFFRQWTISLSRAVDAPTKILAGVPLKVLAPKLAAGARVVLPTVTIGVFQNDLDDMAARLYAWQYEYLWDYTHDDWFALMPWTVETWYGDVNLQQQFAGRLAFSDANVIEVLRECGMELVWNDAGWAADQNIWAGNVEGPDYSESIRYCDKFGMKWLVWMPGHRPLGELNAKAGAWGNFQYRCDGVDAANDGGLLRDTVVEFLTENPSCSFHTCSGGGTFAHTFDWQRLGDIHYDTDAPEPEHSNSYFSYLHLPDKWFDNLAVMSATRRRMITMVPKYHFAPTAEEKALLRNIADLYHYLLKAGVAGRWSLVAHPVVQGDDGTYYFQRLSFDRKRGMIVLKHEVKGEVVVFPRGLRPDQDYLVEGDKGQPVTAKVTSIPVVVLGIDATRQEVMADSKAPGTTRTGRDLMANGIKLKDLPAGTYIYLNLPNRPGAGRDRTAPTAPGRVLSRRETNLGHTGTMLYWSPGSDNNWISYYEIRRGDQILGRTATGLAFFDRSAGWDTGAEYSVRTVDGDGNASGWAKAEPIEDEPLTYAALGAHWPEAGRNGWSAETSTDGSAYQPMAWIPRAGPPAAEVGGSPNQIGGAEGYWEGPDGAHCGRGWQMASTSAMCVRTWVAPKPGAVRITGKATREYYRRGQGKPLNLKIMRGDKQLWPANGWAEVPVNNLDGVTHDFTLNVRSGEAIRFILDKSAMPQDDIIAWMPRIVYTDKSQAKDQPTVVRILCGAKTPYKDKSGNTWSADSFYKGGRVVKTQAAVTGALPTPKDAKLYQHGRSGKQFTYSIPVSPGLYAVRLKFAETKYDYFFQRPFSLKINGRSVLRNFDICQAARAPRKAYERVFRYVVPDQNGRIVLDFSGGWEPTMKSGEAIVQAIEVLPEQKPHVRINVGSDQDLIDWGGYVWKADTLTKAGKTIQSDAALTQASPTLYDQALYRTAATGRDLTYSIPVPPGLYTVHLKFAELWQAEPGMRPMNIEINGHLMRKSWDPATAAGKLNMAADLRQDNITPDKNGRINIRITATGANDAILQGIEIE